MAVTNAISWQTEGIHYRKNEVFLESIHRSFFSLPKLSTSFILNSTG
jgi:hypothetical protein